MNNLDLLVDGEFKIDLKDITLLFKGSSNQRLIDVQATIKNNNEESIGERLKSRNTY